MASSTILSPRPLELTPAASLSDLDQFCSGPLDAFLEEASRFVKRSPVHHHQQGSSVYGLRSNSSKAAAQQAKKAKAAGATKKTQVGLGSGHSVQASPCPGLGWVATWHTVGSAVHCGTRVQ